MAAGSSTPIQAQRRCPRASRRPDNRWQRGDVADALYLADTEETAWAEWYRHLAERMIPPLAQMPRELWTWQVDAEVADLSTAERLAEVGLEPPTPGRHFWAAYQRIGEQLSIDGWAGLLAPSAARPDGMVLCLFRDEHGVRGAKPLTPQRNVKEPPPPQIGLRT
jgi:RES domain-containing protein